MTLSEFKAWFEGFTENINGQPTDKQWKRIKARVREIDGEPITERIFIDRYYRPYVPWWTSMSPTITQPNAWQTVSGKTTNDLMYNAGEAEFRATA